MNNKLTANEISRLLSILIGNVSPVADSSLDRSIDENLMTAIDVMNWMLSMLYDSASHRHSPYGSARNVGERAYMAMLEWKDWITEVEKDLA